jgi:hypothetical protein
VPAGPGRIVCLGQLLQRMLALVSRPEAYDLLYPPPEGWVEPGPYQDPALMAAAGGVGGEGGHRTPYNGSKRGA